MKTSVGNKKSPNNIARKLSSIGLCLLLTFLFLAAFSSANAQGRRDNIKALHTSYITEKLNLTNAEAKAFWPIYDQYRGQKDELRKQHDDNKELIKKAGGIDNMSDADVQKLISSEADIKTREVELDKQYVSKFGQALPIKKVAKFYIAEEEFKMYLLKQLMDRRGGGGRMNERQPEFVPQ